MAPDVIAPELVQPAYFWLPEHHSSATEAVLEFADSIDFVVDPEQRLILDMIYAEREDGRPQTLEVAVILARQNGKTAALELSAMFDLFCDEMEEVIWTAHLFRTTEFAIRDFRYYVDNYDALRSRVAKFPEGKGEEAIILTPQAGGGRLEFLARARTGGRGLFGDRVILDEAFALQPSHIGSLMPTMSTRRNAQIRYGSSAGHADSRVLRDIRDRGRAGGDPSLAYGEWAAPEGGCGSADCDHARGSVDCALDNRENWVSANFATVRGRIGLDFIASERRSMPVEEFCREIMTWWEEPTASSTWLTEAIWAMLQDPDGQMVLPQVSFGVATSWDRTRSALAVAGTRPDGLYQVELVLNDPGTAWVVPWFFDEHGKRRYPNVPIAIAGAGPGNALLPAFGAAGIEPTIASTRDEAAAFGVFHDAVVPTPSSPSTLRHIGQPALTVSAMEAIERRIGDGRVWARHTATAAPIEAATLALWAHVNRDYQPETSLFFFADLDDDEGRGEGQVIDADDEEEIF